jgi:glycosyltransferase involved in cell wall biosynthesis
MYVIHLGFSGFPTGNAAVQRVRLTFKGLKMAGQMPLILNRFSLNMNAKTKTINFYEGIPYITLSYIKQRPNSFIYRNLNKITGIVSELFFLIGKRKKIRCAIYYDSSYFNLLYYRVLAKILGFKLIFQYVELRSSISTRQSLKYKLNDYLFDNFCFSLCDGVIVISDFLRNRVLSKSITLPMIKIPAICDFGDFETTAPVPDDVGKFAFMMYCGTVEYLPVIEFVLEIFQKLKDSNSYQGNLLLVIGGNDLDNFKQLENMIKKNDFSESVIMKKNLLYKNIVPLYQEAELLIIPLRKTLQDIARFPHKVGEYSASKTPIVSTNVGELCYYFHDGVSAILVDEYNVEAYYLKLAQVLKNREKMKQIGLDGYNVGLHNFEYRGQAQLLRDFILKL